MMLKLFILTLTVFYITCGGFSQNIIPEPLSDSTVIGDTSYHNLKSSRSDHDHHDSIPEIFWNTKCIIGGWTRCNPLTDSTGAFICDSILPFIMPVNGKLLRGCSSYHSGWDIGLKAGSPVIAGLGGRVRYAQYCSGYGNLAIIRNISGIEIYYSHLSKLKVKPGQYVEAGDTIGLVGSTGHATTAHLHMEFRLFDKHFDISKIYTLNDSVLYLWKLNQKPPDQHVTQTTGYHTVKKGETLSKIARQYDTSVAILLKLNNLKYNSILRIGQKIRVS